MTSIKDVLRKKLRECVDLAIQKLVKQNQLDFKFINFDNVLTLSESKSEESDDEGNISYIFFKLFF